MRFTTGVGIAVGGVVGAAVALLGAGKRPVSASIPAAATSGVTAARPIAEPATPPPMAAESTASQGAGTAPSAEPASVSATAAASAAAPTTAASAKPASPASAATAPAPGIRPAPPLDPVTSREALLRSEMLCDQKKDFDECTRAAVALETGTAGAADAEQGKRFRKIAITHLVTQCESGSPHACFVMAGKYRAGSELPSNPGSADALEKRGLELCRLRSAPECPTP